MYKSRLGGCADGADKPQLLGYVEIDPSCRYGRLKEILGRGATKTVYKAFDELLGIEVAWSQVSPNQVFRSPEELQRLYSEVHLLKNLNHDSIIKFHTSWIDNDRGTFNFITEMFTSGTLREYTKKYKRVDIRAVKNWARQILRGLAYLHQHDPPVIHRDLKCDNIFVNGHLGQVKIGDLGLAAILRGSQHAHSVIGTPEFMAPELYEEEYDQLVDVYSFGMCVLEMLTTEYPYSECSNPAQIYKKVTSGKLPEAFYRIKDDEAQQFVGKCLETASKRLPAKELLLDPFLASDESETLAIPKVPFQRSTRVDELIKDENVPSLLATSIRTADVTITGTMNPEGDTIFLKVQISDKDSHTRNIYFPFDINNDTAIDVAMEMVKELEIIDLEPMVIAEKIEEEITNLLPSWKDWELSQVNNNPHQHSFSYDDEGLVEEEDGAIHHPFHYASSCSSSQASLQALISSNLPCPSHNAISVHNWLQGELFMNDDTSSQSSTNSNKYSTLNYRDCYDNTSDLGIEEEGDDAPSLNFKRTNHRSTRFCPQGKLYEKEKEKECKQRNQFYNFDPKWGCGTQGKLGRFRSMVDVRSQLLHKSLVEQINRRRRLFMTVGAVENIGYHEPNLPTHNDENLRFKW